jgi:hypothetical protein
MKNWITPKQQEDICLLEQYSCIKHNPHFRCDPRKKKQLLQQYRQRLIERGLDMDKTDIAIFKYYLNGAIPTYHNPMLVIDLNLIHNTFPTTSKPLSSIDLHHIHNLADIN